MMRAVAGRSWDGRIASTAAARILPPHLARVALRFSAMVSVLVISGMVAVHAKRAVFTALAGVPGVRTAEVELGRAVIEHDENTTPDALIDAVTVAGCSVVSIRNERRLPMHD